MRKIYSLICASALLLLCGCEPQTQVQQQKPAPVIYADEQISIRCLDSNRQTDASGVEYCLVLLELTNKSEENIALSSALCFTVNSAEGELCDLLNDSVTVCTTLGDAVSYQSIDGLIAPGEVRCGTVCFALNGSANEYTMSIALDYAADKWVSFYVYSQQE